MKEQMTGGTSEVEAHPQDILNLEAPQLIMLGLEIHNGNF